MFSQKQTIPLLAEEFYVRKIHKKRQANITTVILSPHFPKAFENNKMVVQKWYTEFCFSFSVIHCFCQWWCIQMNETKNENNDPSLKISMMGHCSHFVQGTVVQRHTLQFIDEICNFELMGLGRCIAKSH